MFKVFALLKRRPDLPMEEFKAYYENHHAPFGVSTMTTVRYYARHYMTPTLDPVSGEPCAPPAYDVITELHFDDRDGFDVFMKKLEDPELNALMAKDEDKLFDRTKNSMVFVTSCESQFS